MKLAVTISIGDTKIKEDETKNYIVSNSTIDKIICSINNRVTKGNKK